MLSPSSFDSSRLIETTFITGISYQNIIQYIKRPQYPSSSSTSSLGSVSTSQSLSAEVLFSYPQRKETINTAILEFIFPNGLSVEYSHQKSKFHSIVLTNETGYRTYLYILKSYEAIPINEVLVQSKGNKTLYFPYALCILSSSSHVESFKKILLEMLRVMSFNLTDIPNEESIRNYRHCELLHMMIFLSNVIKPDTQTKLILNMHYSTIPLYFPSFNEIPSNEFNMKLLFDSLEISTIIKLWCSILCEKHIILIANQPILLFSIGEALLSLIFPFKWLHTYISVLPNEQLDYLESPTPYIMGVLSSRVDYVYLNETYSTHVICDINTSEVNQNGISSLSPSEEAKLRKKLQYIRNPDIFDIEDVDVDADYEDYANRDSDNHAENDIEDVDRTKSFAYNVQHIFFRVFRSGLNIMKSNLSLDSNSTFNVQSFLVEYCSEDMKDFWEKLSSTVAFEHYILSFKSLDNSFSRIFKNITTTTIGTVGNKEDIVSVNNTYYALSHLKGSEVFICEINFPKSFNEITEQFDNSINEFRLYLHKLNTDYSSVFTQIRSSIKAYNELKKASMPQQFNQCQCQCQNQSQGLGNKGNITHMYGSMINLLFESTKERDDIVPLAKDWPPIKHIRQQGATIPQCLIHPSSKPITNTGTNTIVTPMNKSTFHYIPNKPQLQQQQPMIKKKPNPFRLYGRNGLLSFLKFLFKSMAPIKDLGYSQQFLSQSLRLLSLKEEANFKLFNCSQVVELDNEDIDSMYLRSSSSDDRKELMSFNNCDCYQYYQLLAFIIAEYSTNAQVEYKDKVIKLFEHSYAMNSKGFSRLRFYQYLDRYNYYELSYLLNKMENEHLEINKKLLVKIIKNKLGKIQKNKKLSCKFNGSPLVESSNSDGKDKDKDKDIGLDTGKDNEVIEELNNSSDTDSECKSVLVFNEFDNDHNINTEVNKEPMSTNTPIKEFNNNKDTNNKETEIITSIEALTKQLNDTPKALTGLLKRRSTNDIRRLTQIHRNITNNTFLNAFKRMSSTLSDSKNPNINLNPLLNDNFDGLTNAERIIEIIKASNEVSSSSSNKDRLIKINVLNVYEQVNSTQKDPISLIEDISVELFSLLIRSAMNKLQSTMISNRLLLSLSNSTEFIRIKKLVAELQAVKVIHLRNQDKNHICFWLNAFNFLTLFAILYKREVPLTYYDWYRFLKNSYFNIGGFDISLYEIENCILRNNKTKMWINGESCDFAKEDKRNVLKIKHVPRQTFFCLALPTVSSPNLKIYFPSTLNKLMTLNAIEYVNSNVAVDAGNYAINIPEYLTWIDEDYSTHLIKYKEIFSKEFFEVLERYKSNVTIEKYDWSINFKNMTN